MRLLDGLRKPQTANGGKQAISKSERTGAPANEKTLGSIDGEAKNEAVAVSPSVGLGDLEYAEMACEVEATAPLNGWAVAASGAWRDRYTVNVEDVARGCV
jgi:hypothetical protein